MEIKPSAVACIVAIVATALVITGAVAVLNNDDGDDSKNISGYWYQIGYQGYFDGKYSESYELNETSSEYNLIIGECRNGMFNGEFMNKKIVGSFDDGQLIFADMFDDKSSHFVFGQYENGLLHVYDISKTGTSYSSYYSVYSTDPAEKCKPFTNIDLSGDWSAYRSLLSDGTSYEQGGKNLTISEQNGNVFKGTMEQTIGNDVVSVEITGIIGNETSGGYSVGYIQAAKDMWMMTTNGKMIDLCTVMEKDTTGKTNQSIATEKTYSRDGTIQKETHMNLEGRTFHMDYMYMSESDSSEYKGITKAFLDFEITFKNQDNGTYYGNVWNSGASYEFVAVQYGTSNLLFTFYNELYSYVAFGSVYGETIKICEIFFDEDATTVYFKNMMENPSADPDILNHWYCSLMLKTDVDGNISYAQGTDYDTSDLRGLDIVKTDGAVFTGYFDSKRIVGIYENGKIEFEMKCEEYVVHFEGYVITDKVIRSTEKYTFDDRTEIRSCFYSTESISSFMSSVNVDINGTWVSESGILYNEDGMINLGKTEIVLNNMYGLLYGTIEHFINGSVSKKNIVGAVYEDNHGNIVAKVTDELAEFTIHIKDGNLYLKCIIEIDGKISVIQRIFVKEGDPQIPKTSVDLDGTVWELKSAVIEVVDDYVPIPEATLSFYKQIRNMFMCTIDLDGTSFEAAGYFSTSADGTVSVCFSDGVQEYNGILDKDGKTLEITVCSEMPHSDAGKLIFKLV